MSIVAFFFSLKKRWYKRSKIITYTTYSQSGPFTDNNPPGIGSAFLNAIENFLVAGWFDSSISSNGSGVLTTTGLTINGPATINSNETVSGTLTVTGDATLSGAGTGLSVSHNASVGGTLAVSGATTLSSSGTGLSVAHNASVGGTLAVTGSATASSINLSNGSLTRISSFSAAVSTSTSSFNHNLGAVPDLILLSVTGGVSTTRTVCYDNTTMTSSQVSLTANSSFTCTGLAIKF